MALSLIAKSFREIMLFYLRIYADFFGLILRQWYRITLYAMVLLLLLLMPGLNRYERLHLKPRVEKLPKEALAIPPPAPYPLNLKKTDPPELTAQGALILDVNSSVILYAKNPEQTFQPASTTKIMTALVVLDYFPLSQVLTVGVPKNEGRTMGLVKDERLTVESLLYGLLVHSANDAAFALAENYPGGVADFVVAMNAKARRLDLTESHFTNPTGFEDDQHFMSARDLARLSLVALQNPTFAKIVSTRSISVADITFSYFHDLVNVNQLLGRLRGVAGLKTGWTESAKECLVTLQIKEQAKVLTVLLRSEDRFGETEKLLAWVGQNFVWTHPSEQDRFLRQSNQK